MTTGSKLVIVESPAKAKKIGGYLGEGYTVWQPEDNCRFAARSPPTRRRSTASSVWT